MQLLEWLESESIYIIRECLARFAKPALLFSAGKDSTVLAHLIAKAVYPKPFPVPLVCVDTGQNFEEVTEFRDRLAARLGAKLIVRTLEETKTLRTRPLPKGVQRNPLQAEALLELTREEGFDALIGGARRDEDKARRKERVFSHRNEGGAWRPEEQHPEPFLLFNTFMKRGDHVRAFPLSDWTEMDIWKYIENERIEVPAIYYAHKRRCVIRTGGELFAASSFLETQAGDREAELTVRCRTVGDITCTGLVRSGADTVGKIIQEIEKATTSERGTRADDANSYHSMEERKRRGYF